MEAKSASNNGSAKCPIVIGHRGASGYRPEHTLESYRLAIEQGADYIEPDVVITKDKVLIARHENEISETTDVAKKYPERKTTKVIDGRRVTGWFTEDFTWKEIQTLRAKERLAFRDHSFDGKFKIPSLAEVFELVNDENKKRKIPLGVYPETKHPTYFRSIGLPLEDALIAELEKAQLNTKSSKVFIQSFELGALRRMRGQTQLPMIFLLEDPANIPFDHIREGDPRTYGDLMKEASLKELAKLIQGIGPSKSWIVPIKNGHTGSPTKFVENAHKFGLKVHPYTFRKEKEFLNVDYKGELENELMQFFKLGVDGVFTDFPDIGIKVRDDFKRVTK